MTDSQTTISKDEFIARFVAEMVKHAGFENFDDEDGPPGNGRGGSVREYAEEMAVSYWHDDMRDDESPEECAQTDMSYWGE